MNIDMNMNLTTFSLPLRLRRGATKTLFIARHKSRPKSSRCCILMCRSCMEYKNVYVCIHIYVHLYVCIHIHVCVCVCVCVLRDAFHSFEILQMLQTHVQILHIYVNVHLHVCIYIHVCVCGHACVCIVRCSSVQNPPDAAYCRTCT